MLVYNAIAGFSRGNRSLSPLLERKLGMDSIKQQIIETGKWIMGKQLTWGTSGNISARDGDRVYVTVSGTVLGSLKEEDVVICGMDGKIIDGEKKLPRKPECILRSTVNARM